MAIYTPGDGISSRASSCMDIDTPFAKTLKHSSRRQERETKTHTKWNILIFWHLLYSLFCCFYLFGLESGTVIITHDTPIVQTLFWTRYRPLWIIFVHYENVSLAEDRKEKHKTHTKNSSIFIGNVSSTKSKLEFLDAKNLKNISYFIQSIIKYVCISKLEHQ